MPTVTLCRRDLITACDLIMISSRRAISSQAGVKYADDCKEGLGLDADNKWFVSPETYKYFDGRKVSHPVSVGSIRTTPVAWGT